MLLANAAKMASSIFFYARLAVTADVDSMEWL
jgi:hypothetical protein